ncbi:Uncharacterised protein [Gordonia paraffinivorans]|uniref:DUF5926 domain-containing protein n=1 Tax=Gordonia paraffinivorans TaxID=175628 RepID=A0ABD7V3C7_9ACTN|nr:DUF5926 family protein [Gordonia paraffinivorans]VFA88839.1 Uncharacterised protein [Gordonia paraffinivorans]
MGKKSKRGSGPRPGSNRAERVAARKARQAAALAPPPRPFAGLAAECDLVALRTFVASATAPLELAEPAGSRNEVSIVTILPGAGPALARENGGATEGLVALQTEPDRAAPAIELAAAIAWAAHAEAGSEFDLEAADESPSLDEVIKADATLDITVHDDFAWWFPEGTEIPAEIKPMLERANDSVLPTARLVVDSGNGAPWWVDAGERAHLRWIRPEPEDDLVAAMARLHAAGRLTLGEGSRFAGSFRTHGLLVPVFDLDNEMHHEEWHAGLNQLDEWLSEALAETTPLTTAELRSRDGIRGRQVTLR